MKNNITLNILAAYLPYKVKLQTELGILRMDDLRTSDKYKVWCIDKSKLTANEWVTDETNKIISPNSGRGFMLSEIKPILRPLSDLTKPILYEGETFVPLLRMIKECHFTDTYELKLMELPDSRSHRKHYRVGYDDMRIYWDVLMYTDGMRYDYVQKLLSWHFNIFNISEDQYTKL